MANTNGGVGSTPEPQFSCSLVPSFLAGAQLLPHTRLPPCPDSAQPTGQDPLPAAPWGQAA